VNDDSADLVARLRAGDEAAEAEFRASFGDLARRWAASRLRDPEAAHGVAQEVLLLSLRALREGTIRDEDNLAGFVYGTARRVIAGRLRRRAREQPVRPEIPPIDPRAGPEVAVAGHELALRLLGEIDRLPARDRRLLYDLVVDALPAERIADRMGLTPDVVRKRKSRIVATLRQRLSDDPAG